MASADVQGTKFEAKMNLDRWGSSYEINHFHEIRIINLEQRIENDSSLVDLDWDTDGKGAIYVSVGTGRTNSTTKLGCKLHTMKISGRVL